MHSPFLTNGITAHRGNPRDFPENTLPGFNDGIALGADWLELDIQLSKDGQVVVCHDDSTGRTANDNLLIAETSFAELSRLDVAHAFRNQHGLTHAQCPPQRLPLLSDVITLVKRQYRTRLSIQLKSNIADDCARVIAKLHAEEWIGFNEGDYHRLLAMRRHLPHAHCFYDVAQGPMGIEEQIDIARTHAFQAIVMHHATVSPHKCRLIRQAGLEPGAWNVADPSLMQSLLAQGVFRLYCDAPRLLATLLKDQQP